MDMKVNQELVKQLRIEKSWSQEKLAEEAGLSLRTIQRMELDGSASLKSRLAVANALDIAPSALDPQIAEKAHELETEEDQQSKLQRENAWPEWLRYPGPSSISRKIRTPLLIALWLGMMTTGALILVMTITLTVLGITNQDIPLIQLFMAQVPIFVIFVICVGLYRFFHRFKESSS